MAVITLSNVTKHFGSDLILDGLYFALERGDRVALVGSNGAGKSTILRIISGLEAPDSGTVSISRNIKVGYLPQEPKFDVSNTLYEAMLEVFREAIEAQEQLRHLEREMEHNGHDPHLLHEYGRLQSLVEHAGYDYREKIERVLTGLGLQRDIWHMPMDKLSGGQKTRANLARTLLQDSDVLLLDEPTNHLDIEAVEWLEGFLRELPSGFIIVAHDRYLLDRVTKRTLDLSFGKVTGYDAPYSRYLDLKAERLARQRQEYEAQQQHIARTEEFIRRYGAGQRYKEARGRQKRLDRLERVDRPVEESEVRLRLSQPKRSGDIVLEVRQLIAGYDNKPLVHLPNEVIVRRGETVATIGPNGSGKTTLLRTLVGTLPPVHGTVRWGANTSRGYYSQTLAQLDQGRTVLAEVQRTKALGEEEARNYLGRFLFSGDDVFKTVRMLSGGEKSRVALAKLILEEPNVLILDEPTNHLDIASRDALESVLSEFQGTLLFVSHDRYLIDSLAEHLWVLEDGRLVRYDGNYSAYREGRAKPFDRESKDYLAGAKNGRSHSSPASDEQLSQFADEAEALAERLAASAPTIGVSDLSQLTDRYAEVQARLVEAQDAWLQSVQDQLR